MTSRIGRAIAVLRRAARRVRKAPLAQRALTLAVCALAGFMIVTSAIASRGTDLRPNRNTDLISLVRDRAQRNAALSEEVAGLRADVDALTTSVNPDTTLEGKLEEAAAVGGLTPVKGPAVSVTLTDAPLSVKPVGVDEDLLVVHQQDIQAVVNALWSGGAEAMTIQGQRVTARTGIKCVGNTVVLHGTPYAPPYVITAIGDVRRLEAALASSSYLRIYQQYVERYKLGYAQQTLAEVTMPAYKATLDLEFANQVS